MNRHLIFRHYPAIAVLGGTLGITVVLVFATADRMPLIGSVIVGVLGFSYFVQQQKLSETALFKDLFTEFNRRYDALNDRLAEIAESGAKHEITSLDSKDRQTIVDYFNLCAEEYLFFSEGYIHPAAWRSWCAGMLWYFDREPFKALWTKECAKNSYYGLSVESIRRGAASGKENLWPCVLAMWGTGLALPRSLPLWRTESYKSCRLPACFGFPLTKF